MSSLKDFTIGPIDRDSATALVLENHYTYILGRGQRVPGIKYAFGLFDNDEPVGCVLYSIPASYTLCRGVCGPEYQKQVLELSRLVITTPIKNAASYLVGNSIRMLEGDWVLVSYADGNESVGHVGYIYQATNWIYTGRGNAEPAWADPRTGEVISYTRRHIDTKAARLGLEVKDLIKIPQVGKHRYVNWTGNRRFVRKAKSDLRYEIFPYPKGPTLRHQPIGV